MIVGVYFYGLSAEPSSKYCETGKSGAKGSGGAASHRAQELKPTASHQNAQRDARAQAGCCAGHGGRGDGPEIVNQCLDLLGLVHVAILRRILVLACEHHTVRGTDLTPLPSCRA